MLAVLVLWSGVVAAQAPPEQGPLPPTAAAPPAAPTAAQTARAKKLFQDGNALMKEELYQQAIAAFAEANSLAPRESIQNNLARARRELKDMAGACREYELLLDKYGDKMTPARKAAAMRALEELSVLTGVAVVSVSEPDVAVLVDGAEVGRTPLGKPIRLNLGSHTIALQKAGFEPLLQNVEVHGHDSVSIHGPLLQEVLTGHVAVAVEPPDPTTQVLVDNAPVGPAPWAGDLAPGPHIILARSDTMASEPSAVNVVKRGSVDLHLTQIAQVGTLVVHAGLPAAAISVDGKVIAQGALETSLPVGPHDLEVSAPGFAPFKMSVGIAAGQRTQQSVELLPAPFVAPPHDWKGVYAQLMFAALFEAGKPTNDIAQGVGYTGPSALDPMGTQVTGAGAIGGGLNVRVGYSFGLIGIEGSVLGTFDHSSATANITQSQNSVQHPAGSPPPTDAYSEAYDFYRFGADITVGARLMPKFQVARPTLAVGLGVAVKGMLYGRDINANQNQNAPAGSFSSSVTPYVAPVLSIDGGIELGRTPGTRFYVGALMLAEFPGATEAQGNTTQSASGVTTAFPAAHINVVSGPEVFVGPILGMQFGE